VPECKKKQKEAGGRPGWEDFQRYATWAKAARLIPLCKKKKSGRGGGNCHDVVGAQPGEGGFFFGSSRQGGGTVAQVKNRRGEGEGERELPEDLTPGVAVPRTLLSEGSGQEGNRGTLFYSCGWCSAWTYLSLLNQAPGGILLIGTWGEGEDKGRVRKQGI